VIPEDKAIVSIFQDSKNNYWFGTNGNGVYFYDGSSVKTYSKNEGLYNNDIIDIQEDHLGNIYFDTVDGICKFDGSAFTTLEFASFSIISNEWKLEENDLWFRIGWDHNGPIRYDGNNLYELEFPRTSRTDEFYKQNPDASYSPTGIYEIYKDNKGHMWFGTADAGIYRYDGKKIEWMYEEHLSMTPEGGNFGIRSIIEDKDGYFWICNNKHRYKITQAGNSIRKQNTIEYQRLDGIKVLGESQNHLQYFLSSTKDKDENLWFATFGEGVFFYDGKVLEHIKLDNIGNPNIRTIYVDNNNNIWLGTQSSGIFKLKNKEFTKVSF